ncbi:MAG: Beta-barrel assembly-enhancing protease [Anaerolineales bacterium]|nr:Beta-barrel assembly-enhancing protease [Anaerolineales bacterium]
MSGREDVFQKTMNDGHSAAWDQQWAKAAASYRAALQEFPNHPKALSSLALALYQQSRFEEALDTYKRVAQISPDDPISMERVAQLSERLGDLQTAMDAAMRAAEKYINQREIEKAMENWARVTTLNPDHLLAHSRLALTHERLGHIQPAVTEYLAVASLIQRAGNVEKTEEIINKALQLMPHSPEAKQAQALLKSGQLLPKPVRPKGGTGPIRMSQVKQLDAPTRPVSSGMDPLMEARQKALTRLAEALFEYSDDNPAALERRGLQAIVRGTGQLSLQQAEQTRVVLHLGQAIDSQTKNQELQAAEELEQAIEAGFKHSAAYFDLGLLRFKLERFESAQRNIQHAVKHADFALAARLLLGQIHLKLARYKEAAIEYLEALKLADSLVVAPELADEVRQLYEPILEAQSTQTDDGAFKSLCENIHKMLMRADWREHLMKAREQLPRAEGEIPLPLAEIVMQAQSSQVLESINVIHQLARQGYLRSAMDAAFDAVIHAPQYLPLHTLMGDLLVQEGRTPEAIAKFSTAAQAYGARGEANQATKLLKRVIALAPMDLTARSRLIDQLAARGLVNDAINEYLELAGMYYRLAELDMARKTYTTALRFVQQSNADRAWNIHILHRMADIDMQRLDWKQAIRIFEQIRTLNPEDAAIRKTLIELNLRMAQLPKALEEMESYLSYLEGQGEEGQAVPFLEELVNEHGEQPALRRALAAGYHRAGRLEEAIAQLDTAGELLLTSRDKDGAIATINQILMMNPPNADDYRKLLAQIGG